MKLHIIVVYIEPRNTVQNMIKIIKRKKYPFVTVKLYIIKKPINIQ